MKPTHSVELNVEAPKRPSSSKPESKLYSADTRVKLQKANLDSRYGGNEVSLQNENGDYESFFWTDYGNNWTSRWTVKDQKRLVSADALFSRALEFHNNIHSFCSWDIIEEIENDLIEDDELHSVAVEVTYFNETSFKTTEDVSFKNLVSKIYDLKKFADAGLLWINVKDKRALPMLASISFLSMHSLVLMGFYDLRAHSTVLPTSSGSFLLSLCTYKLNGDVFHMYKTFIYNHYQQPDEDESDSSSPKIIITYEHELMPDIESDMEAATNKMAASNASGGGGKDVKNPMSTGQDCHHHHDKDMSLIEIVQSRAPVMNVESLMHLGTVYIIYEIAMEALMAQDRILEFFSRTLFYFKDKVHIHLQHAEKLIIHRKMHIIVSAMMIMSSNVSESASCFMRLLDPPAAMKRVMHEQEHARANSDGVIPYKSRRRTNTSHAMPRASGGSVHDGNHKHGHGDSVHGQVGVSLSIIEVDHLPYIYHLMDTYDFAKQCIANAIESGRGLSQTMDAVSQLRTDHTATTLSLIATIFLPLTFVAGVFGMNFQIDGGYTMYLLNVYWGMIFFYVLCVVILLVCVGYFMKQGWISGIHMPKALRKYMSCFINKKSIIADSSSFGIFSISKSFSGDDPTNKNNASSDASNSKDVTRHDLAEIEEQKRQEVADAKRSMMNMTSLDRASIAYNPRLQAKLAGNRGNSMSLASGQPLPQPRPSKAI